jgi:hypothetical protein
MYERVPNPTVILISRISCNQATVGIGGSIGTLMTWDWLGTECTDSREYRCNLLIEARYTTIINKVRVFFRNKNKENQ